MGCYNFYDDDWRDDDNGNFKLNLKASLLHHSHN